MLGSCSFDLWKSWMETNNTSHFYGFIGYTLAGYLIYPYFRYLDREAIKKNEKSDKPACLSNDPYSMG